MSRVGEKRAYPYESSRDETLPKRAPLSQHPGWERQAPRVVEDPSYQRGQQLDDTALTDHTDFNAWTDEEMKAFLDARGEDYDDCKDRRALVARASEVERCSGKAVKPSAVKGGAGAAEEGDDDPLDAFMADIAATVEEHRNKAAAEPPVGKQGRAEGLACDEQEDHVAEYMEIRGSHSVPAGLGGAAADDGYNSDEDVYAAAKALEGPEVPEDAGAARRKNIELLPRVAHEEVEYMEVGKDFYTPVPDIARLTDAEVAERRRALQVRVAGYDVPAPVGTFGQCGLDAALLMAIKKAAYTEPTPIQAQALPAVLNGRDVLGIAKTGSGKTAAYVLPMITHIMDQPELQKNEGPIGVVLAPTRELAEQIHKETRRFGKAYNLAVCAAFGGLSKHEQFKVLKNGAEVAVATPGRLIDLIRMKACNMRRATYLVLDEADRMFDMGFEPQVRSVIGQIRPDRQTLLFSATMPRRIELLASDCLAAPIRITVGQVGAANEDIRQAVEVLPDEAAKQVWLMQSLPRFVDEGDVLVFAGQKARVDALVESLQAAGFRVAGMHGDLDQASRMHILSQYRAGDYHVLVATDVAARGLDIKSIKTVINYDAARDIDTHVHRIGRTGRAGDKDGTAYTLVLENQGRFASLLVKCLSAAGQPVPPALHHLAMKDPQFRKQTRRNKGGRVSGRTQGRQLGGAGLGFSAAASSAAPAPSPSGFVRGAGGGGAPSGFVRGAGGGGAPSGFVRGGGGSGAGGGGAVEVVLPANAAGTAPATMEAARKELQGLRQAQGRMHTSFVSKGTTGSEIGRKPVIVMPQKKTDSRPLPPPPTPVTQQPLYLTRGISASASHQPPAGGRIPHAPAAHTPPSASAADTSPGFPEALLRAQQIASRLSASAGTPAGMPAPAGSNMPAASAPTPSTAPSAPASDARLRAQEVAQRLARAAAGMGGGAAGSGGSFQS